MIYSIHIYSFFLTTSLIFFNQNFYFSKCVKSKIEKKKDEKNKFMIKGIFISYISTYNYHFPII